MRLRLLLTLLLVAPAAVVCAQVFATPPTASHVICDSGCAAGTPGQTTMANSSPVVIASDQSAVPVSLASVPAHNVTNAGTFAVQVSSAPANASTNVTQWNGTTVDGNSGLKSAGTLRVVLATDQPALTNKLLVTPDSVALPANQSVNVNQLAGTTTDTNSGVKSAGTLRVVLATDQPQLTNKLLVTPDANSAVNVAQFGGTNIVTGTGAGGAGIPRVTISNDSSLAANQSVNVNQIAGSAASTAATGVLKVGVVGNAGAAVDAANNAAAPANVIVGGLETIAIGSQPTAATAGNVRRQLATTEGVAFVQEGSSNRFSCFVASTATATTQCQAAPGAGLRAYVTSVVLVNAVQTAQSIDLVFGTGTNCGTGTTALTAKWFWVGATESGPLNASASFTTPLVPTAANAICVRPTAATAFGATITGFIAP